METCVLIPSEYSLVLRPNNGYKSLTKNGVLNSHGSKVKKNDENGNRFYEMNVCVWSNQYIRKGSCFLPFQGTIRLDRLEVFSLLDDNDIRNQFGCFDEIQEVDNQKVRHCNWIRFLRHINTLSSEVNLIGRIVHGEVIYETITNVSPNTEMIVYYDVKKIHDSSYPSLYPSLFTSSPVIQSHNHHAFICRQALQDSPLDLSMSLVKSPSSPVDCKPTYSTSDCTPLSLDLSKSSSYASSTSSSVASPNASLSPSSINSTVPINRSNGSKTNTAKHCTNGNHELPINLNGGGSSSPSPLANSTGINKAGGRTATTLASNGIVKKPRERTMLPCEYCGKAFDRPSLLRRHLRTHTGEKPHVCDVCGKGFSTSSSLNTHRRIHSGEKPHQCNVCGKRFTASSNLYYHRMTHNKEKPHKCTLCSKSFPTPGDLKSHMYVHNGSWPFKCHICNRGFSKQTNLRNHMYLHTGDRPHECEVCQKKFALACNLRAHLKTHEEPQNERCQRCGREFPTATGLVTFGCCHECYHNSHGIPLLRQK